MWRRKARQSSRQIKEYEWNHRKWGTSRRSEQSTELKGEFKGSGDEAEIIWEQFIAGIAYRVQFSRIYSIGNYYTLYFEQMSIMF